MIKKFTLIENLVMIAIVIVVASILIIALTEGKDKSRIAKGQKFSQSIHYSLGVESVIAVWSFDTIHEDVVSDISGNNNHGVIVGTNKVPGIVGEALYFDGVDDYVIIGRPEDLNFTGIDEFTIEAWVKLSGTTDSTMEIVSKTGAGPRVQYELLVRSFGQPRFYVGTGQEKNGAGRGGPTLSIGKWHHLVGVYDGLNVMLYVDGEQRQVAEEVYYPSDSAGEVFIGSRSDSSRHFLGAIDEIRIYSKALNAFEIRGKYYADLEEHNSLGYFQ